MIGVSQPDIGRTVKFRRKKERQPDSYGSLSGTGSQPHAATSPVIKPTVMGGTFEVRRHPEGQVLARFVP